MGGAPVARVSKEIPSARKGNALGGNRVMPLAGVG